MHTRHECCVICLRLNDKEPLVRRALCHALMPQATRCLCRRKPLRQRRPTLLRFNEKAYSGKRPDTVGHSISTQHSYCYCVGLSIFLGLQRQHMRGTIFGMWGMTNSIRAISARSPQKKCYAYPRCTFLSNSGAAGQGGNLRHCERVFFNMRLVAPTCLLLEEKSPLLSDIPVLCYRRAEEHASLETRQDGQTVRRSCASTTPRTVGMPMVGRLV